MFLVAAALACTGQPPVEAAPPHDAQAEAGTACPARQRQADGGCCPAGHAFDAVAASCLPVGPPECADVLATAPETCQPRWCWDRRTQAGVACAEGDPGCQIHGRVCAPAELASGPSCPAGRVPVAGASGACVAAGAFPGSGVAADWSGTPATLGAVPDVAASVPAGVPSVTALPPLADTFFCLTDGAPRFCAADGAATCQRDASGRLPTAPGCRHVGVPWPSHACPPGFLLQAPLPAGDEAWPPCQADPADCADDAYGDALLADGVNVRFVDGTKGSDAAPGTRAAPLKSITVALGQVPWGGIVAVAQGTYAESVKIDKPVTLRGRCAALVTVTGQAGKAVLEVTGSGAGAQILVRGLRLSASGRGVYVTAATPVRFERLWLDGLHEFGLVVTGKTASMHMESVVVHGTLPDPASGQIGSGIEVHAGAQATLVDVRVSANRTRGLYATGKATQVTADSVLIDGTLPQASDDLYGAGIALLSPARIDLTRARLRRNHQAAIHVDGPQAWLDARQVLIDGTRPQKKTQAYGFGLVVLGGAEVSLASVRLSGNRNAGAAVEGSNSRLTAAGLLVDGTQAMAATGQFGRGLTGVLGARLHLSDVRLAGNREGGLLLYGKGTEATVVRALVDGTLPSATDKAFGAGIGVSGAARLVLQGARLTANRMAGLVLADAGTQAQVTGLLVDGTQPMLSNLNFGQGISVAGGATLDLSDARLSGNHMAGIWLGKGEVQASHLVVDHTQPRGKDASGGVGVLLADELGGRITLAHARLSGNLKAGLQVAKHGEVTAWGLLVDHTLPAADSGAEGRGVLAHDGASLDLHGAVLVANRTAGLTAIETERARVTGALFRDTLQDEKGQAGNGAFFAGAQGVDLASCAFFGNHASAVSFVLTAEARLANSLLWHTLPSEHVAFQGDRIELVSLADGLVVIDSQGLQADGLLIGDHARAGVLTRDSSGLSLSNVLASGGAFGLAMAGSDPPELIGSVFSGGQQDVAGSEGLFVAPPPVAAPIAVQAP